MKKTIAIIVIIISLVFIIPYGVIKFILDAYYDLFCFILDFVCKHLNIEKEIQEISTCIDDNLYEN